MMILSALMSVARMRKWSALTREVLDLLRCLQERPPIEVAGLRFDLPAKIDEAQSLFDAWMAARRGPDEPQLELVE